ncbi:MAG TPA: hypothetical protein VI818_06785 [Candidatus Thermoplasmatota archaeon]|nr:hypothetical protein [Candidatus Thermoplasmatota archaeon]
MRFVPLVGLVVLLAAASSAQAGLVKKYEFSVDVAALDFGGEQQGGQSLKLALLTGQFDATGSRQGLHGFVAVSEGAVTNASKIEVINTEDSAGIAQRCGPLVLAGERDLGKLMENSCAAERTFFSANMTLGPQANLLLYNDAARFNHTSGAGFALVTLFKPPQDLAGGSVANLSITLETSLLAVGQAIASAGHLETPSNKTYSFLPDENSTVIVSDGIQSQEYRGRQYLFRFYGQPDYDIESTGLLVPFVANTTAEMRPTAESVLRDEFRPESINVVLKSFGSSEEVVNAEFADGARQIAPILNGVFFGTAGASTVNEETQDEFELGLIRYGHVILTPTTAGAVATGKSDFLLLGTNGFYTTQKGVMLGPMAMPNLAMILWVLAAGAIIGGFVLKPALAGPQLGGFGLIRLIALIFHGVAFILSFLLWDNEVHDFLGTSLVRTISDSGFSQVTVLGVTALFEVVPYFLGLFMFGMPIRFIVNSGLKMGGLQKARGIGKGIGNLAVWGLGTPFIPFFLNGLVQPFVDALQNALSQG